MKFVVIIFAMLNLFGCSYKSINHGTEINESQINEIVDGKTTKDEILVKFGDPSKILNDDKAYFYTWTRGTKAHLLGIGTGTAYTHSLVVIFDDNNIVKSHKITRGTTKENAGVYD